MRKGSALDIVISANVYPSTIALLSTHAQQIKHLKFPHTHWSDILSFSKTITEPLPLLRTLKIHTTWNRRNQPYVSTTPLLPLFGGFVNLEEFDWCSDAPLGLDTKLTGSLGRFIFPNLTTFKLTVSPIEGLNASDLLNFLKTSPLLRKVEVDIFGSIMPGRIPQNTIIILPNLETFSMCGRGGVYESATHISCPRAKRISLTNNTFDTNMTYGREIFPAPASWMTILHQYPTSPVEEVTLKVEDAGRFISHHTVTTYSLTFQSSDETFICLSSGLHDGHLEEERLDLTRGEMRREILSQACRAIRSHPLLSHVKRLHITNTSETLGFDDLLATVDVVGELFTSLGPLDELTIRGRGLDVILAPFVNLPGLRCPKQEFPHVKKLRILEPLMLNKRHCMDGLEEPAKLQHGLGKPFELVTFFARFIPETEVEGLRPWVSAVECYQVGTMW